MIKRILGITVLALLATGCATSSSVNQLSDRVAALERQNQDTDAKLSDINKKLDTQSGDLQAARKELADTNAAAQKAQQAASDAQAAAARAEQAADKATKAFELRQRKGSR